MTIATAALVIVIIMLALYIVFVQRQLRLINRQLDKRLAEHTRQPVRLELLSRELNALAININKCLKAEETLRLKSIREEKNFKELIANISHDLRTPLTAIKGYQQLLANSELTGEQQMKLQIARKHADELGGLIERFFEYAYLLNAEPSLHIKKINLSNLAAECIASSVPVLEEHHQTVEFGASQPVFALADQEMVTRILQNLIRNCIQHSAGSIQADVQATTDKAVLSFKNPVKRDLPIDVKRLFDRFYTGDQTRSNSTGLGLSIVKLLAEQMDGDADAIMQDGWLEVRVELPLSR